LDPPSAGLEVAKPSLAEVLVLRPPGVPLDLSVLGGFFFFFGEG